MTARVPDRVPWRQGLLLVAILAFVGHVCAPSVHASLLDLALGHGSHQEDGTEDGHLASCEAAVSKTPAPPVDAVIAPGPSVLLEPARLVTSPFVDARVLQLGSRPLFLRHAALLI